MKKLISTIAVLVVAHMPQYCLAEQGVIEEVIVYATKRAESIQDVPIAVTAISGESLDRAGVKDIRDLSMVATSFNMNSTQTESQGTTLRIRGVGTAGNNIGLESAVGVFMDGVYLSRPGVALGDLMDVEIIEVLRGPQGTLFGRNTSAGALNIRTKKPNMTEHEFFANATVGNHEQFNVQAGASGPLADQLGYRIAGAIRHQDAFLDSTSGAESLDRDRLFLRGQLLWDINERAELRIIADYADADERCCDAVNVLETPAAALGSFAAAGLPADGGIQATGDTAFRRRLSNAEQTENPFESWGVSAELNWELGESATLTYIGAYRDFFADSTQHDFNGIDVYSVSPEVSGGFAGLADDIETFTHELRVAGVFGQLDWLVGGYYADEDIVEEFGLGLGLDYSAHTEAILWNFAFAPVLAAAPLLGGVPMATGGTFADVLAAPSRAIAFGGGLDSNGAFAQNRFQQSSKSWSVFTHNVLHVTDRLDLVAGLRYAEEDKDGSFEQIGAGNPGACLNTLANAGALIAGAAGTGLEVVASTIGNFSAVFSCFPFAAPALGVSILPAEFDDTFKDDELMYTGKVVFAFTDTITGYVGFTHGFKSGGFNLDPTAAAAGASPSFDSEVVDAWEIGIKSELFGRRLRANLSLFDYDLEDFQVLEFTGSQFITFNVPNAKSQGAELELLASPSDGLELMLGVTYADARYPNNCDGGDPNAPASVSSLCGADFTNAPEIVVTAGFGYDGYLGDNLVYFLSGNMRWEDDRRTGTQPNLPFDIQQDNAKLNLRVGLGTPDGRWMVELWGVNVTDKQTKNVTFNTPLRVGSRSAFLEAPRTYGITLRTKM